MYKIGIGIGMLLFQNKKSILVRLKFSKLVRINIGKNRFKVNPTIPIGDVFKTWNKVAQLVQNID